LRPPDDRDATERVVQVYRAFDARGTAIADDGHGGVRLNGDDALVHGHRCRAARELAAILKQAGQLGTARRRAKPGNAVVRGENLAELTCRARPSHASSIV
jgi:hypothetical protein